LLAGDVALQHLAEVGCKVLIPDTPFQHIGPRPADLIDDGRAY